MNQVKKFILERIKDSDLYIFLGITLLFFGIFILKDYTIDSYLFFQETWRQPFFHLAALGRLITAGFWLAFSWTSFHITYLASFGIAILATTFSMYELNHILKQNIKNQTIAKLISVLVVINISTLELYMFFEKGIMMLSVLLNILAVGQLDKALNGNKKAWVIILIEMFIANCCYQGTVGLFVALGTIFIIKNTKNLLGFMKNNLIVAILYAIPAILNLCIVKFIFHSGRVEGSISLFDKVTGIVASTTNILKNTFGILPPYVFVGMLMGFSVLFIWQVIRKKETIKGKIWLIFALIYVMAATVFSAIAPQIMQAFVYMVPRNVFSLGAILGIVLILFYHKLEVGKVLNSVILLASILFLVVQFYNFMDIIKGHYYTNQKDMAMAQRIATVVREYEEETNQRIEKVVLYKDNIPMQYPKVRYIGDANVRAFSTDWGARGILDVVLGRQVKVINEKDAEYEEFFKSKDWKDFNEEQIKFRDDTLHLCII